jgi:hypothetical protein
MGVILGFQGQKAGYVQDAPELREAEGDVPTRIMGTRKMGLAFLWLVLRF